MELEDLAPSAKDPVVQHTIAANAANKAIGRDLQHKLPLWQTLAARLRSCVLLAIIYITFWPCATAVLLLSWLCKSKSVLSSSNSNSTGLISRWISRRTAKRLLLSQQYTNGHHHATAAGADTAAAHMTATNGVAAVNGHAAQLQDVLQSQRTVVVTGGKMTKALHVCRHMHAAGWRVVLVETHKYWHVGSRLSAAVDAFYTVPAPEASPVEYVQGIVDVVKRERASMFIPVSSPVASLYDALAAEALQNGEEVDCRCWTLPAVTTAMLDHKGMFSDHAKSLGLSVPQHYVVTSAQQLLKLNSEQVLGPGKRFVLKSIAYDSIHRTDLTTLPCQPQQLATYLSKPDIVISDQQPWILQEFIKGKEYSCYSLAHQGRLIAHSDTTAELSNLNYKYEGHPGIKTWVQTFIERSGASGQLCFDFIESDSTGQLYCIECNPRTSSVITEFHDHPYFAQAFASPDAVPGTILPLPSSPATYWWWNEVARLLTSPPGHMLEFVHVVTHGVDAVFLPEDPWPFLGLHYVQVPLLLLGNIIRGNPWKKVDLCIGKVAELYGD